MTRSFDVFDRDDFRNPDDLDRGASGGSESFWSARVRLSELHRKEERADAHDFQAGAKRETLCHSAGNSQTREGSRSLAERDPVEVLYLQSLIVQQLANHRQQQRRVPLARVSFTRVDRSIPPEGNGAVFGGSVERQDFHRRILDHRDPDSGSV